MGKMKNIEIDLLNFKEDDIFQEKNFLERQKIKRKYYTEKFNNQELEQKGKIQLRFLF